MHVSCYNHTVENGSHNFDYIPWRNPSLHERTYITYIVKLITVKCCSFRQWSEAVFSQPGVVRSASSWWDTITSSASATTWRRHRSTPTLDSVASRSTVWESAGRHSDQVTGTSATSFVLCLSTVPSLFTCITAYRGEWFGSHVWWPHYLGDSPLDVCPVSSVT